MRTQCIHISMSFHRMDEANNPCPLDTFSAGSICSLLATDLGHKNFMVLSALGMYETVPVPVWDHERGVV